MALDLSTFQQPAAFPISTGHQSAKKSGKLHFRSIVADQGTKRSVA